MSRRLIYKKLPKSFKKLPKEYMTEITRETVTTQGNYTTHTAAVPKAAVATNSQTVEYLIYFVFGIVDVLLAFRLVLKLMGASLSSGFTTFIYGLTGIFIFPFVGIFHRGFTQGIDATAVLEPATIVAIIVYAVLAWGIVKLMQILSREPQTT